jgi:hypothetical protein
LDGQEFEKLLEYWQARGRSIYWITVQGGYNWPVFGWTLEKISAYDIQATALEGAYSHRPSALAPVHWQGQVAEVKRE